MNRFNYWNTRNGAHYVRGRAASLFSNYYRLPFDGRRLFLRVAVRTTPSFFPWKRFRSIVATAFAFDDPLSTFSQRGYSVRKGHPVSLTPQVVFPGFFSNNTDQFLISFPLTLTCARTKCRQRRRFAIRLGRPDFYESSNRVFGMVRSNG